MVITTQISFCCGLLLLCLLFFPHLQNASARVLKTDNELQFRRVTKPGEQKIQSPREVVSAASWLRVNVLHTGRPLTRGVNFLKNNLWKKSKSHVHEKTAVSLGVGSFDLALDHEKIATGFDKLDKGMPTPGSGPNPGRKHLPPLTKQRGKIIGSVEAILVTSSKSPKGWSAPSGPSRLHREKPEKMRKNVLDKILKEEALKSEKQGPQSASQSKKGEALIWDQNQEVVLHSSKMNGDAEELILNVQLLPKGATPPPGPNLGHNGAILVADPKPAFQSAPTTPTTPSGPNPLHNSVTESENSEKLHVESMPKGSTPPSGPNPGGNAAIFAKKEVAAAGRDQLVFNSLPKESTPTSGPILPHNTIPQMSSKQELEVQLLPKGPTPPSSPNPGGNMIPTSTLVQKQVPGNRLDDDNSGIEIVQDSTSASSKTPPGSDPTSPPEELTVSMLPKGFKPPSSPNKKHSEPSDIKNSLGTSKAHQAAQSAKANSLDDNILVLNDLSKSPTQISSPDPIHHSTHVTASQKSVDETHREISELSSDSRKNLSELVGCQKDIIPFEFYQDDQLAPATLFSRPAAAYA